MHSHLLIKSYRRLNSYLGKDCVFNDIKHQYMKYWIRENNSRPELPDRLSCAGIHFCLIPAKACSVHAKHTCYRNTSRCSSPGVCSIRPSQTSHRETIFFPTTATLSRHRASSSPCTGCSALHPVPGTMSWEGKYSLQPHLFSCSLWSTPVCCQQCLYCYS